MQADFSLPRSNSLQAANGTQIVTFGTRIINLSFAPGQRVRHTFWAANVSRPILCFFETHRLLIDIPQRRLVGPHETFTAMGEATPILHGIHTTPVGPFESILADFPNLMVQNFRSKIKHNIRHFIPTTGPPLHSRARPLDGKKLEVARAEFQTMENLGIIRSDSPWASPLHVIPKADGT